VSDCPICGSSNTRFFTSLNSPYLARDENYRIYTCSDCGHGVALGRQDDRYLSEIYSDGFHHSTQQDTSDLRAPVYVNARQRVRWLTSIGLSGRLLDIGAGKGAFVEAAQGAFAAAGIELSADAAAEARSRGIPIECGDFLAKENDRNTFDVITLWDVIAGFRNPQQVMAKCHAMLKPDGTLVMTVPMVDSFVAQALKRYWPLMIPPVNLQYFSRKSLKVLAREAGFEIVAIDLPSKKVAANFLCAKAFRSAGLFSIADFLGKVIPAFPVSLNTRDIGCVTFRRTA
jgi:SAM-dependent methyltransferase